jgi:plasmid stabilization system protein ParE
MSPKQVEYHEGAGRDVKAAVAWYGKRSRRAASDFIEELNRAAQTIAAAPDRWPPGKNNTRRFLLWRFPFCIIYSEQESAITIWAVAHGSRRPEYWVSRAK